MTEFLFTHLKEIFVISLVVALSVSFVLYFVLPSQKIIKKLTETISKLEQTKPNTSPSEVLSIFGEDRALKAIWREYGKTLHLQQEVVDGELKVTAVFSTVTSDAYFNPESVFEGRINSEFFKHLPGILTGLGIIGTFLGLIVGLQSFASIELGNPQETQRGLQQLMEAVGGAFVVSATAIVAAMAITLVEKLLVKQLTSLIHELVQAIDALYDAGASEDYLARLVKASEESAAQTKILKDALVKELGDLLRELTDAQIAAATSNANSIQANMQNQGQEIGAAVSKSINEGLKGPLDKVADLVATASGEQSSAATKMLQEVMTSFSQKLNDLFGGQISEINRLNQEAATSIKQAVDGIQNLVNALQDSGQKTADEMSQRMLDAIEKMAARQDQINAQSSAFVEELKKIMAEGQTQTQEKLLETMTAMQEQMLKISTAMTGAQNEVFEGNRAREKEMADRATTMVDGMSDSVKSAVEEISKASKTIADSVDALGRTTSSAIDRMNTGAQLIAVAAEDFTKAGNSVGNVLTQSSGLVEKINSTSANLSTSASSLQDALQDYQAQRSSLTSMLSDFKQTVELAKKDTQLTGDVLVRLEKATTQLGQAETAAEEYLANVTKVLAETHESFTREMSNSVATANRDFHRNLKTAIDLLATTIADLEASLGSAIGRKN
jgi:MotA/TolQ/ExbB proton channel family